MQVKIINKSDHPLPSYETIASAGMDIRAYIPEAIVLEPMERAIVKTGLFIELPVGIEAQVRPRSGLAAKKGITVLNSPGTIDADYRGEIGVILVNLSNDAFTVENGEPQIFETSAVHHFSDLQNRIKQYHKMKKEGVI